MSLALGTVYEYDGWVFVPVSFDWPVFTVLTLQETSSGRLYGAIGQTCEVFANSMVGQNAQELK